MAGEADPHDDDPTVEVRYGHRLLEIQESVHTALGGEVHATRRDCERAEESVHPHERRDGLPGTHSPRAGQGRDLREVLTCHPRKPDVAARLVELDPRNAKVAMDAVAAAGLDRVEVVTGDASTTRAYEGMVPCDLVLACGVFGHAADGEIENTIRHLPTLCAPKATVVWTRGELGSDIRPAIRRWFIRAGFEEIGFTTGDGGWGVGASLTNHRSSMTQHSLSKP